MRNSEKDFSKWVHSKTLRYPKSTLIFAINKYFYLYDRLCQ